MYFHNFESPKGKAQYIWINVVGKRNIDRMALIDTGAWILILPFSIWLQMNNRFKDNLAIPDTRIWAGNSTRVNCRGMTLITIIIDDIQFRYKFYVCADGKQVILGYDFQQDCKIHLNRSRVLLF